MGDMFYRRTCYTGGYILLDDMHYMSHVLWKGMSHKRTCLTVGHVLWEGGVMHVGRTLVEDFSAGGHVFRRTCLTRGHVLLENMSYERPCLT